MNLGDRIKHARQNAGLTQKQLADSVGISQTAVHKLERGYSRASRRTVTIALTCGVDPIWLETGRGDMLLPGAPNSKSGIEQVSNQPFRPYTIIARVPLVSWETAYDYCSEKIDYDQLESAAESLIPVAPKTRTQCFALNISDDTMEPLFTEGDTIIVEPNPSASHNQYIIAQLGNNAYFTFKQFIMLGNKRYLKPLNKRYPLIEIETDFTIFGVVISKYREFVSV